MGMPSPEHQPATAPTVPGQRLRMSYEEFLAWSDEDACGVGGRGGDQREGSGAMWMGSR
jgi:hypothetical protein